MLTLHDSAVKRLSSVDAAAMPEPEAPPEEPAGPPPPPPLGRVTFVLTCDLVCHQDAADTDGDGVPDGEASIGGIGGGGFYLRCAHSLARTRARGGQQPASQSVGASSHNSAKTWSGRWPQIEPAAPTRSLALSLFLSGGRPINDRHHARTPRQSIAVETHGRPCERALGALVASPPSRTVSAEPDDDNAPAVTMRPRHLVLFRLPPNRRYAFSPFDGSRVTSAALGAEPFENPLDEEAAPHERRNQPEHPAHVPNWKRGEARGVCFLTY